MSKDDAFMAEIERAERDRRAAQARIDADAKNAIRRTLAEAETVLTPEEYAKVEAHCERELQRINDEALLAGLITVRGATVLETLAAFEALRAVRQRLDALAQNDPGADSR
jgi:hypothetical protein